MLSGKTSIFQGNYASFKLCLQLYDSYHMMVVVFSSVNSTLTAGTSKAQRSKRMRNRETRDGQKCMWLVTETRMKKKMGFGGITCKLKKTNLIQERNWWIKGGREGMVVVLLDHEFLKESYDWQSHAAGLCIHTPHCTAAQTRTHKRPCTQSNKRSLGVSVASLLCVCVLQNHFILMGEWKMYTATCMHVYSVY